MFSTNIGPAIPACKKAFNFLLPREFLLNHFRLTGLAEPAAQFIFLFWEKGQSIIFSSDHLLTTATKSLFFVSHTFFIKIQYSL